MWLLKPKDNYLKAKERLINPLEYILKDKIHSKLPFRKISKG